MSDWQRFRVEQFGGIVRSSPRGTTPLAFRELEGFTFGRMPGGLSIDRGLSLRATMSAGTFERLIAISATSSFTPTVYAQTTAGEVYSFESPYATSTLETLGSDASPLRAFAGGTLGVTCINGTGDAEPSPTAYTTAFLAPSRVNNTLTDPAPVSTGFAFTGEPRGGGWQTTGSYNIVLIPLVAVNDGTTTRYVWTRDPRITPFNLAAPPTSVSRLDISWEGSNMDAVSVLIAHANDAYYASAGVFTASPSAVYGPPVETRAYRTEPERLSRARGDLVVSRQGRTWLAGNASRDYSLEPPANQNPSAGSNAGRAL